MVLTVDSEELNGNYSGFSERKIKLIKETFVLFQHFSYEDDTANWKMIKMDGAMFGNPQYIYYIYKQPNKGILGQVYKKTGGYQTMLFGFHINTEKDGKTPLYLAYHDSMAREYDDEI